MLVIYTIVAAWTFAVGVTLTAAIGLLFLGEKTLRVLFWVIEKLKPKEK